MNREWIVLVVSSEATAEVASVVGKREGDDTPIMLPLEIAHSNGENFADRLRHTRQTKRAMVSTGTIWTSKTI